MSELLQPLLYASDDVYESTCSHYMKELDISYKISWSDAEKCLNTTMTISCIYKDFMNLWSRYGLYLNQIVMYNNYVYYRIVALSESASDLYLESKNLSKLIIFKDYKVTMLIPRFEMTNIVKLFRLLELLIECKHDHVSILIKALQVEDLIE